MALDKDKQPIAFTRADGLRIRESVRAYERLFRNNAPDRRQRATNNTPMRLAKTTTSVAAMAGSTVGTGTIELYSVDSAGAATATGTTGTVYNMGGSVASGKFVLVSTGPWGWWLVVVAC